MEISYSLKRTMSNKFMTIETVPNYSPHHVPDNLQVKIYGWEGNNNKLAREFQ